MKNRVKAGLGLAGLGAISVGGVAAADPSLLGIGKDSMPPWLALSKDHDFLKNKEKPANGSIQEVNDPYKGKFGDLYQNYFVGVVGPIESGNVNKDFWEWAFERLKKEPALSNNFKYSEIENEAKVFRAISGENGKGLNQICKDVYKADFDKSTSYINDTNNYKEEDVWKFCSPVGQRPTTIQQYDKDNYYGQGKIGETHKSQLISVRDPKNYWFWEIRDWEIKGNNKVTCWKIDEDSSDGTYFYSQRNSKHIKYLCASAYRSNNQGSNPKENETKKYCSLLFNGATATSKNQ